MMGCVKTCLKCGLEKPIIDFHKNGKRGRCAYCKPCKKRIDAASYPKRAVRHRELVRIGTKRHTDWMDSLKAGPCADCKDATLLSCQKHWDHLPGTEKLFDISKLRYHASREKILKEITKCELVCANCHALRTRNRHHSTRL